MSRLRVATGTVVLTAGAIVASCFSGDPVALAPEECLQLAEEAGATPGSVVVGIVNFSFQPSEVTVTPGTRITWVNCEPQGTQDGSHTSTSDENVWSSALLSRGDVFERTFGEAGAFPYHCVPHPFMQGTITVESASAS